MDETEIRQILTTAHTIATVGLSANPDKPGHRVARYLMDHGYRVIPVNPTVTEVLGQTSYPSLLDVPEKVDVVQIFRRSADVPPVVAQAIQIGAHVVWMQEGIINEEAAAQARAAGLKVLMDRCMMKDHRRLM